MDVMAVVRPRRLDLPVVDAKMELAPGHLAARDRYCPQAQVEAAARMGIELAQDVAAGLIVRRGSLDPCGDRKFSGAEAGRSIGRNFQVRRATVKAGGGRGASGWPGRREISGALRRMAAMPGVVADISRQLPMAEQRRGRPGGRPVRCDREGRQGQGSEKSSKAEAVARGERRSPGGHDSAIMLRQRGAAPRKSTDFAAG